MKVCFSSSCVCRHHFTLLKMIQSGDNEGALSLLHLIQNAHHTQQVNTSYFYLLHYAVACKNVAMALYLIQSGEYDLNAKDGYQMTPFMLAVNMNHSELITVFLAHSCDIYDPKRSWVSAINYAFTRDLDAAFSPDRHIKFQNLLTLLERLNSEFLSQGNELSSEILQLLDDSVKLGVIIFGSYELAEYILQLRHDINMRENNSGKTALHYAMILGESNRVRFLLDYGANVDMVDENNESVVSYYVKYVAKFDDDDGILDRILSDSQDLFVTRAKDRLTDIELLLVSARETSILKVLEARIQVNSSCAMSLLELFTHQLTQNSTTSGPLINLLIHNCHCNSLEFLEEKMINFEVNTTTLNGLTPLMSAARRGSLKIVDFLLKHGANTDYVCHDGKSALFYAINNEDPKLDKNITEICELLIQHESDVQSIVDGRSMLEITFLRRRNAITDMIIARLAVLYKSLSTKVSTKSLEQMKRDNSPYKSYFDVCTQQMDRIRQLPVWGRVTLFKLLTASDKQILSYARNGDLVIKFNSLISTILDIEPYYSRTLQARITRAIEKSTLIDRAVAVVEKLTGFSSTVNVIIIDKIISYLRRQDLMVLCQMQ